MKSIIVTILLPVLVLFNCLTNSNKSNNKVSNKMAIDANQESDKDLFSKVYSLTRKDNSIIGDVYVKFITPPHPLRGELRYDSVFTDLYVVNDQNDTLYTIKRIVFTTIKGKDFDVPEEDFYGYYFLHKGNDYFDLIYVQKKGLSVSDNIPIEWNYEKNVLELRRYPF